MKNDVMKMLTTMASANIQYFLAIGRGFSHRAYCIILVKIIGNVSSEIAMVGSITNVKKAIAAAGRPIPKNPLTIPANRKIAITARVMARSCDGRMLLLINSIKWLSAYPCFCGARLDDSAR